MRTLLLLLAGSLCVVAQNVNNNTGSGNGSPGPGYKATSATSNVAIASSGSKSLNTQADLAYSAGARVRATDGSNVANYMEGVVTSYSDTTLVFTADTSGGSGTPSSWNINLAGNVGNGSIRGCQITFGSPGAASAALGDDDDMPLQCSNFDGGDHVITGVGCHSEGGAATVTPILTGGTAILTDALTCSTTAGTYASGTISGTPTIHSFSADGATCASAPCTIDGNITSANSAKYIVIQIHW